MENWSRFSPEKLDEAEKALIQMSKVDLERNYIPLSGGRHLYCLTGGSEKNPPIVFLHGYCGAGMIYFKIVKDFAEHYRVYILDLLGMGHSSRPEFTATSLEESEAFFVEAIEEFRNITELEKFILVGHSFGGYVASCYTIKYTRRVEKLLLLSPVGFPRRPKGFNYLESISKRDWKFRFAWKVLMFFWVKNITPVQILRKVGPLSWFMIKFFVNDRFQELTLEELAHVKDYLEQINLMPASGELALVHILEPGAWAFKPLCKRLKDVRVPMAFFYGDRDWMSPEGAEQTAQYSGKSVIIHTISNSDHHLYWDNPRELSQKMMRSIEDMKYIN